MTLQILSKPVLCQLARKSCSFVFVLHGNSSSRDESRRDEKRKVVPGVWGILSLQLSNTCPASILSVLLLDQNETGLCPL